MRHTAWRSRILTVLLLGLASGMTLAKLPAPTPEQQQAAAAKKAQAAAQQEKEKQQLSESMDRIAERWRGRAAKEGWKTHPPTPVAATGAPTQAAQPTPGQPVAGQPGGTAAAPTMPPIRSEKFGTAPPSEDVKTNKPSNAKVNERIYKNPVEEPPHKKPAK